MFNIPEKWLIDRGFELCPYKQGWVKGNLVVSCWPVLVWFTTDSGYDIDLYPRSLEQLDCLVQMLFPAEKT